MLFTRTISLGLTAIECMLDLIAHTPHPLQYQLYPIIRLMCDPGIHAGIAQEQVLLAAPVLVLTLVQYKYNCNTVFRDDHGFK
jgi:hypothetical protein